MSKDQATNPGIVQKNIREYSGVQSVQRVATQWQLGDWRSMLMLRPDEIANDSNRSTLAIFYAAALFQVGENLLAKEYVALALNWGAEKLDIKRILVAGVYFSLGRSKILSGQSLKAESHLRTAVRLVFPEADHTLLATSHMRNLVFNTGIEENLASSSSSSSAISKVESRLFFLNGFMQELQKEKECLELQRKSKYYTTFGYKKLEYWTDRHKEHGLAFTGSGDKGFTNEENFSIYKKALVQFESMCHKNKINFSNSRVLDVGCGNGFYADFFHRSGVKEYTGIDITNVLLKELSDKFQGYTFKQLDITTQSINETFDLIIMIDVTQHIVNEEDFIFAMNNIRRCLSKNGIFIVTSWLDPQKKNLYYERSRGMESYKRLFKGWHFSSPIKFRDKYIFSIRYQH